MKERKYVGKSDEKFIIAYVTGILRSLKEHGYTREASIEKYNEKMREQMPSFLKDIEMFSQEMGEVRRMKGGPAGFPVGYMDLLSDSAKRGREIGAIIRKATNEVFGPPPRNVEKKAKTKASNAKANDKKMVQMVMDEVKAPTPQDDFDRALDLFRKCAQTGTVPNFNAASILLGMTITEVSEMQTRLRLEGFTFRQADGGVFWYVSAPKTKSERLNELRDQLTKIAREIDEITKDG